MVSISASPAWENLITHYHEIEPLHMRDLFEQDPTGSTVFHCVWGIYVSIFPRTASPKRRWLCSSTWLKKPACPERSKRCSAATKY